MMAQGPTRSESLSDLALLAQVVRHKEAFYPSFRAHYELAHPGNVRLIQRPECIIALEKDYRNMGVMIFGEPPSFDSIIETLDALEKQING